LKENPVKLCSTSFAHVDKTRLVKRLGQLNTAAADVVLDVLSELFAR